MIRRRAAAGSLALGLALVAACGEDARPGALVATGGSSPGSGAGGSTGSRPGGGDAGDSASQGGAAGDAAEQGGAAGHDGDGGIGNIGQIGGFSGEWGFGGTPVLVPPECEPEAGWGAPLEIGELNSTPADDALLAVTPDELSLLFARGEELFIADRAAADGDFDPEVQVTVPAGFDVTRGAALSPDGLRIVLVASDAKSFGQLTRADRSSTFGTELDAAPYAAINTASVYTGTSLSAPALAASDETLYYTGDAGYSRVHVSRRADGAWSAGAVIDQFTLSGSNEHAKLVTGVSPDELTIFVFDEALGHVVAYWRDTPSSPFYTPTALEGLTAAQAAAGCARLYTSAPGGQSLDLFTRLP